MTFGMTVVLFVTLLSNPSWGEEKSWATPWRSPSGSADFKKKVEGKENTRWTLKEWMEQKEKNRMMDLWLGMYSPSPYELILTGQYETYDATINQGTGTHFYSGSGSAAFYAMILGVEAFYDNNSKENYQDMHGLVHLRVLGNSNQSTHLDLSYGTRKRHQEDFDLQQQVAGADLELYIEKHIGLHGAYRYYLPATEDHWGQTEGKKTEVGAFFDISFLRFFGNWFSENLDSKLNDVKTQRQRSGFQYGLKFFF